MRHGPGWQPANQRLIRDRHVAMPLPFSIETTTRANSDFRSTGVFGPMQKFQDSTR